MNVQTEIYNLEFTATVDERNRVVIPPAISAVISVKKGDKVTLIVRAIHKIVKGA